MTTNFDYWLKKLIGRRETIVTPLDPDLVKKDEIVKAQQQKIAGLTAELGKLKAKEHEEKEEDKKKDKDQILIKKLREKEKIINENVSSNLISLNLLLKDASSKRLRGQIRIVDRDGKFVDIFGGIGISENEYLTLLNETGHMIIKGREIRHIIYKPEGLVESILAKRIQIPYILDKNLNLVYDADLENLDHPDMVRNENDHVYDMTEEKTAKVKNLLIKKGNEILRLRGDKEKLEHIVTELKTELDDFSRGNRILEHERNILQTHLSKAMESGIHIMAKSGEMQRQITQLAETNVLHEQMKMKLESINEKLLAKFEEMGVNTKNEMIFRNIQDMMDWLEPKVTKTVTQIIEPEKKEVPIVQPGQHIK